MTFQPPPPGGPPPPPPEGWAPPPPPPEPVDPPSWAPPGPPAVPPRKSRRGLVIGLGLLAAALLVLLVVGLATVASRVGGGTALSELRRGQCFNTSKGLVAQQAERVACTKPHTDEVAGVLTIPAGDDADYPGGKGILDFAKQGCTEQAAEFFGSTQRAPSTQTFVFGPDEAAWNKGDRTVVCSVREESGASRTGSYLDR